MGPALALFIVIGFAQQSPVYISSMLTVMVLLLPVNALAYDETANGTPTPLPCL